MSTRSWDVFLGAGLSQPSCAERNREVIELIRSVGMTVFAPQEELPLGCSATPEEILERNRVGIENSHVFLFVPDGAGEGVYYELGLADAQSKLIIGFSSNGVDGHGKVIQGRWAVLPPRRKPRSLDELRNALKEVMQAVDQLGQK
jgi:nucleoside 2-deoxyribosyltransferase